MKKFIITMLLIVSTATMLTAEPSRKRYEVVKADAAVVLEMTSVKKELEYQGIGKCYLVELDEDDRELFEKATADLKYLPYVAGSFDIETRQLCSIVKHNGEMILRVTYIGTDIRVFQVSVYKVITQDGEY